MRIYKNGYWFLWIANSRLQIGDLNVGYSGDLKTGTRDQCKQKFGRISTLQYHVQMVHGEKSHKCTIFAINNIDF